LYTSKSHTPRVKQYIIGYIPWDREGVKLLFQEYQTEFFTSMIGDGRGSSIWMTEELMTSFLANQNQPQIVEKLYHFPIGDRGHAAHI